MKIRINKKIIDLSYKFIANDTPQWDENGLLHPHFKIIVKRGSKKQIFDFWGSVQDYFDSKTSLTKQELTEVLGVITYDAIAATETLCEFMDNTGYECEEAMQTYEECRKTYQKLKELGLNDNDLYEIVNQY